MTAISYDGTVPDIGGDDDAWGGILNVSAFAKIKDDLDMLNNAGATTILGRKEATAGDVQRLTPAEVAAMLPAVAGDTGTGGTKGLVPAPGAGDAAAKKVLQADGTWIEPYNERKAWAVFTGATGALVAGRNVSVVRAGAGDYDITFSTALPNSNYAVLLGHSPNAGTPATPQLLSVVDKSAAGFTIGSIDYDLGTVVDPEQVSFEVLAL